jgi:anti-sigma B factor antagonist
MPADATFTLDLDASPPVVLLTARGELDAASLADVSAAFDRAIADYDRHVVLDGSAISFIDSTGVSAMVAAMRRLNRGRRRLAVACPSDSPLGRALAMTGLDHMFDMHRTAQDAVTALDGAPLIGR